MLGGTYLTSSSPCGQNCSFTLDVIGPSFECVEQIDSDIISLLNSSGHVSSKTTDQPIAFMAAMKYISVGVVVTGQGQFNMQWMPGDSLQSNASFRNLSCIAHESAYTMNVSYLEGQQTVTAELHQGGVLDTSYMFNHGAFYSSCGENETMCIVTNSTLSAEAAFYSSCNGDPTTCIITNSTFGTKAGNFSIPGLFRRSNIAAVKDTIVTGLTGILTLGGRRPHFDPPQQLNTFIRECAALSTAEPHPTFSIPAAIMQSLLQNVTISMLTLANTNITVAAKLTYFINLYAFEHPKNLIVPYFMSLAVGLVFIVAGFVALMDNGVSASTGGFLQILCTTTGSEELKKAAAGGCLGGMENVPQELKRLVVQFGELVGDEGEMVPRAGVGVVVEVRELDKEKIYGG